MSSVPAGRREVNVRGDENCFYGAMALAVDGKTDHVYPVFRAMCDEIIAEYSKVFEAYQFSSKTIKKHLRKVRRTEREQKRWTFLVVRLYFSVR